MWKVGASFYSILPLPLEVKCERRQEPHFIVYFLCLILLWSNDVVGRSFILLNIASFLCILPPPSEVKRRRMEKLYFTVMLPLLSEVKLCGSQELHFLLSEVKRSKLGDHFSGKYIAFSIGDRILYKVKLYFFIFLFNLILSNLPKLVQFNHFFTF